MIFRVIISFIIAALLAPASSLQHQSSFKPAFKLKDVNEFGCCGIDLELSLLTEAIGKEPEARAHIIGYSGLGDPPGKLLRYLRYIEANLPNLISDKSHAISVINGGQRNRFTIEMWIVPKGASVPTPSGSASETNSDARSAYKFDEAEASIMEYNKKSYLAFGLACTLSYPEWEEFFRTLRDKPTLRGLIMIYVGHDDGVQYGSRIEKYLRAELKKVGAREEKELTMVNGGKREWSQIEIWLVPKGKPDPQPTPRTKNVRAR